MATVGLVVCAPLLALIALAIKLDSRGPVLFVQERVGQHAKTFKLCSQRNPYAMDQPERAARIAGATARGTDELMRALTPVSS